MLKKKKNIAQHLKIFFCFLKNTIKHLMRYEVKFSNLYQHSVISLPPIKQMYMVL